ncbi:metal-dependent hydrolase [Methanoculleus horonobensis]|jgi:inner membrane protein|uniref:metal-dependent hydrolase n=1 Tax=Methanoculleus horonobensis TaxID=528314 RepID=UPI000836EB2A|nr:metal-dependent hydrolase [Methanoculleus horonobensis]MDD3070341.1 metal-dependent hydrolase [Methanoculleus horonobensis]MDD4251571.1 metal-dependent hydrolase [Methanoculleus horonobensis]
MRGDQHASLSLATTALLIAPWATVIDPSVIAVLFFGVFVGSLAPDADAVDAAIFNGRIAGAKGKRGQVVNGFAVVLPIFGYTIRYLIYYPLSLVFMLLLRKSYRHRHRGLLHSFPGVGLTALVLSGYLALILTWLGSSLALLPAFGCAFFAGCILHLMEDTCTPAGVAWLYPFSRRRVAGRVRSQGLFEVRPAAFSIVLVIAAAGMAVAPFVTAIPVEGLGSLVLVAAPALWLLFMLVSRVRPERRRR